MRTISRLGLVLGLLCLGVATPHITSAAGPPRCGGRVATIVGTPHRDVIRGTPRSDVIVARGGADVVRGGAGDDVICGGPGADLIRGGPGDDELRVGPVRALTRPDVVAFDTSGRGVRVDLAEGTATGQGRDRIVATETAVRGSSHDDVLLGDPTTFNELVGLGGDDRLVGGALGDQLAGDSAHGGSASGQDVLVGGAGDDALTGGPGRDVVSGGDGADTFYALPGQPSGSDRLRGGTGDDFIEDVVGPREHDRYVGGDGDRDTLWLRTRFQVHGHGRSPSGRMVLDGTWTTFGRRPAHGTTSAIEQVILPVGAWRVTGTDADEWLWAPRGVVDRLHRGVHLDGGGGDDNLIGTEYDDVLIGGAGTDMACGRGGNDRVEAEEQAEQPILLCDPR